jgi:hypothetical protein
MADNTRVAEYDFNPHISGDTFKGLVFELELNDVPVDLTGYRIRMHLKRNPLRETPKVFSFDTMAGSDATITILDPALGKFRLDPCIIDVPPFNYVYDIEFIKDNVVRTFISGNWKILPDVTRDSNIKQ